MTSIEWIENQIIEHKKNFGIPPTEKGYMNLLEQAKEMHKKEMVNFGNDLIAQNDINYIGIPNLAEQYYNQTFKKD